MRVWTALQAWEKDVGKHDVAGQVSAHQPPLLAQRAQPAGLGRLLRGDPLGHNLRNRGGGSEEESLSGVRTLLFSVCFPRADAALISSPVLCIAERKGHTTAGVGGLGG